ncbi:hypothetical protein AYO08_05260 [Pseudomonas putida]|nr:hypothetical protein AYO08_05260 [Pseudomonas putida]
MGEKGTLKHYAPDLLAPVKAWLYKAPRKMTSTEAHLARGLNDQWASRFCNRTALLKRRLHRI